MTCLVSICRGWIDVPSDPLHEKDSGVLFSVISLVFQRGGRQITFSGLWTFLSPPLRYECF